MSLEQTDTNIGEKQSKKSRGYWRKKRATKRSQLQEKQALEDKEAMGIDLSSNQKGRLEVLRDIYD